MRCVLTLLVVIIFLAACSQQQGPRYAPMDIHGGKVLDTQTGRVWQLDYGNPPRWIVVSDEIPTPEQAERDRIAEAAENARKATLTPEEARREQLAEIDRLSAEAKAWEKARGKKTNEIKK